MPENNRPVLEVVVGSTRPGRVGRPVAEWVFARAKADGRFDVELVDLVDVGLELLNEPHHPRLRQYTHEYTKRWSATVDRADAFVFVVPEYNHGVSAAMKNAIDHLVHEWAYKPVGLVSYGGVSGGTRAVNALKPTMSVLKMLPLTEGVIVPMVATFLQGEGADRKFVPNAEIEAGATAMFEELARTIPVLSQLRRS